MEIVVRSQGGASVIDLAGRLDAHQSKHVTQMLANTVAATPRVIVNLKQVHFIDSTGLATLVRGMRQSHEKAGDLVLCDLQQPVRIIFELTKLDRAFHIYASEQAALQALQ